MKHTNNGQQYWLQEVPMDTYTLIGKVFNGELKYKNEDCRWTDNYLTAPIPDGTWQIHSDSLTMTEEQAGEIVEKSDVDGWYKGYDTKGDYKVLSCTSAVKSFHSLLRSLGLQDKRIIVLKQL